MAEEAKAKGNAAFSAGDHEAAVRHFSDAIALAPSNHVLYSNRSAAYASLNNFAEALADAKKTVELKPDWPKGYSRLGAAYVGSHNYGDAISAYKKGLEIDPHNEALKSGLKDAEAAAAKSFRSRAPPTDNPFNSAFAGPEMWAKLTADPTTRSYLQQPDFITMMQEIQKNPNNLNLYLKDQRVMQALGVLLNVKFKGPTGDDMEIPEEESPKKSEPAKEEKKPEPEPEPMELTEDGKEKKDRKAQALKEKEEGNAAYKKKDFEKAIAHYTKALELDDEDISYLTNRAAVYLEMGQYEECIKDCDKAVERGRELRSDFKMLARALTRKGTALVKMAKCSKDFEPAIETFQKALTEHRNPDTLKRLNEAEKAKKELEQQEIFDPTIADEEREKDRPCACAYAHLCIRTHAFHYLSHPVIHVFSAYSNRAACYTKLGALPEALKDAEKCIELDPTFSKGYTRKGAAQFFMKEYDKALETYQEGLKLDPENQELLDGMRRCVQQINKAGRGELSPEELKERQAKAMQDPEIQNILSDPVMRQVLVDFQENPKAAQEHMKNPMVMNKIQKLINAGIVQMR
ncbi:hypothetical protein Pint_15937 [Pistacia integerrima]|uniref:Uncharacterized protein n=1 Tax=Pistacia integerrima TaxID=434235 RepID=A0ACC0ZC63_9ROSI|nr:hypothetical protein Pint_15937 [Pistacia integerrima]